MTTNSGYQEPEAQKPFYFLKMERLLRDLAGDFQLVKVEWQGTDKRNPLIQRWYEFPVDALTVTQLDGRRFQLISTDELIRQLALHQVHTQRMVHDDKAHLWISAHDLEKAFKEPGPHRFNGRMVSTLFISLAKQKQALMDDPITTVHPLFGGRVR